ncbi:MAG TPA: GAF domain-containing SpoIIE family protein phosphatase [Jatrophihabitans sp.]|nr:GAF domain-containing SpoIIE family protein phosphatase [Jatrophihabitans sp.]
MMSPPDGELSEILEAVEAASPVEAVDAVTAKLAVALEADRGAFLIADLAGRALVRLGHGEGGAATARRLGEESAEVLPLTESLIGDVVSEQRPLIAPVAGGWRILAPVTQRGEVIGVLEVVLARQPEHDAVELVRRAAHVLAFVVIANRRHTDLFEWGQRTTDFELSAEIQRRLLPGAFTCEAGAFTVSAWLEPAASIGGDTFDYSLERDVLHLSVTDAMGHGVSSALLATLCVGSLRNSRRAGASLTEQAAAADAAMAANAQGSFVTGLLGRVDLQTGVLQLVNAGHVLPLLVRGGDITEVALPVDLPFGLNGERGYRHTELPLEPGDRFVIVTDGMLERGAVELPLAELLDQTRGRHPREATRRLADAVIEIAGPRLADDATILVIDWHGGHGRDRDSRAGADRQ